MHYLVGFRSFAFPALVRSKSPSHQGSAERIFLWAEQMKGLLEYEPDTGLFRWIVSRSYRVKVGSIAGALSPKGYVLISISGRRYAAHRLAFYFIEGKFPDDQVDHIDGDRKNNRFSNLRKCTGSQNNENRKTPINNTSGYMGVSQSGRKWRARIKSEGKYLNLGTFCTKEQAHKAYLDKKSEVHTFNPIPRELL